MSITRSFGIYKGSSTLGGDFGVRKKKGSGTDTVSMIWSITTPSDSFTFRIQGQTGAAYNNYDIDWGDGNSESGITIPNKEHTYATAGLYEIKVTGSIYIRQQTSTWSNCYTEWKQWGTGATVTGFREFFYNCINMSYSATDAPNFGMLGTSYDGLYRSFYNCDSITSLDLSGWDVSTLTNIGQACFQGMNNLESLNISNWDISGITTWSQSLAQIGASTTGGCALNAANLNVSGATTLSQCLYNSAFSSIDVSNWTLRAAGTSINQCFRGIGSTNAAFYGICTLDISTWNNTSAISSANGQLLFYQSYGLTDINLTNFDFTGVTNFASCFSNCHYLVNIQGLESQVWSSATSMSNCFVNTYRLKFDTYNFGNTFGSSWAVTNFEKCFNKCGSSNAEGSRSVFPNITNWDTSNATTVNQMFRDSKWNGTASFAPSASWDLSNITSFLLFAYNHVGIQTWDWTNVTISNSCTNMKQFITTVSGSPYSLTSVIFGANCDFSAVITWANFAQGRAALTQLEFDSGVDFQSTQQMSNFANNSPIETTYYDALLVRLDATNNINSVTLSMNLAQFTTGSAAETSKDQLVNNQSWTITDAGGT